MDRGHGVFQGEQKEGERGERDMTMAKSQVQGEPLVTSPRLHI